MVRGMAEAPGRSSPRAELTRDGALWGEREASLDISVVVPFYNPGERFRANVEQLLGVLAGTGASFEVIAVSDGSTDGSAEAVNSLAGTRLVVLNRNRGKGEALRVGLAQGRGRYLGFIDADGDVAPEVLDSFVRLMPNEPDIVFGSKRHPRSQVSYPSLRRLYSWGYQQMVRLLFRLDVRDTQCGAKLVRRDVVAAVLPRMVEKRFAFDLELFVVARHLGYVDFLEAPVRVDLKFPSTISPRAVLETLLETLAIFYRLRVRRFYDSPHEEGELAGRGPAASTR
jgi:glycosyltransferase involved in cell wall biosynthesis